MTVKELRERLHNLPDEALVVSGGFDHSYLRVTTCREETAEQMPDGHMSEYWDDANMMSPDSKKIQVVVE